MVHNFIVGVGLATCYGVARFSRWSYKKAAAIPWKEVGEVLECVAYALNPPLIGDLNV